VTGPDDGNLHGGFLLLGQLSGADHAAVDHQHLAGDESCIDREEKADGTDETGRPFEAVDRIFIVMATASMPIAALASAMDIV
jgi:hypothetical protein